MNKKNSTKIRKNILFFSYLKILIRAKWDYKKIKKKKFLLVDGDDNPFLKYYNKKDFNIIHRRGESINTRVLLKCILNFNLTALNYYRYFIKLADPKLIFTAFDYHPIFYKLSKLSGVKTFMLQKGTRNKNDLIMQNKNLIDKDKKKKFFVDYIFLYNKFVGNFYKKIIKGKYINIGHFENNCEKINFSQQKKEILFISNFKIDKNNKLQLNCENDDQVVYNLHKLAISKKIKFSILPKQTGNKKRLEFLFYKNLLKKNFIFVKKKNRSMTYKIVNKYKYVFCTYSTLGTEIISKGGRAGFIFFVSKDNPAKHFRFGSLENIPKKGDFWTSSENFNLSELKRVFNFVIKSKEKIWKMKSQFVIKNILEFDCHNKIFRSIVSNELKKNKSNNEIKF